MSLVEYRIVAGEHSLSVDSGLEQIRAVSSIVTHPNFDDITYEDDISLIFVSTSLVSFDIRAFCYAPHISSSR
jgi:trypsin